MTESSLCKSDQGRIAWLKEIDIKEKARIQQAKQILTIRANTLKKTINELAIDNGFDTQINSELEQIEQIFKTMFPQDNFSSLLLNN